jgi:hypothetical protein
LKSSIASSPISVFASRILGLWLLVLPFSVGLANVLMGLNLLLIPLLPKVREHIKTSDFLRHPLLSIYILTAISLLWSADVGFGIRELKTQLPLVMSALIISVWSAFDREVVIKGLHLLFYGCLLAFGITAAFNLLPFDMVLQWYEPLSGLLKPFEESDRALFGWYTPFMFRMQFGNMLSYTGMAMIFLGWHLERRVWIPKGLLLFLMVFVLGTRGALLGILAALPFLFLGFFKVKKPAISSRWIWPVLAILLLFGWLALPKLQQRWNQTKFELEVIAQGEHTSFPYQHFTTLTRLNSWSNSLELWKQYPILGTGIGDYKTEYAKTYENDPIPIDLYYHSQWLYYLCVVGFAGLLLYLIAVLLWYRRQRDGSFRQYYALSLLIFSAVIWIFDAGLLAQLDMMTLGIFTSITSCLSRDSISST